MCQTRASELLCAPWPTMFYPHYIQCVIHFMKLMAVFSAVLWRAHPRQPGVAPTDSLPIETVSLVWNLGTTLKGRIVIQKRSVENKYVLYSHISHFIIIIPYILRNTTQNLCFLLETNTEVFKANPGFLGNRSNFWLNFFLWFILCLAVHISISCFWHLFCIRTNIFMQFFCRDKKTHRFNTLIICTSK